MVGASYAGQQITRTSRAGRVASMVAGVDRVYEAMELIADMPDGTAILDVPAR